MTLESQAIAAYTKASNAGNADISDLGDVWALVVGNYTASAFAADTTEWANGSLVDIDGARHVVSTSGTGQHANAATTPVQAFDLRVSQEETFAFYKDALTTGRKTPFIEGKLYIKRATTNGASGSIGFFDLDTAAIREPGVRNLFMSTFFTDQGNHKVNFCTSNDGDTFSTLNASAIPLGSNDVVELRDPSPIFFNNEWWYFGTGASEGSHDFVVMKSSSVLPEVKYRVALGGGPYYSATIPYPGGTAPASAIWAPEPFIDDGKLYIAIAIRYGADFTNAYGNTGIHMKSFISECLDPDQMLFGTPVPIDFGADTQSLIDASIVKEGSTYWCAVKDDDQKNIRIYSASTRTGTYALNQVLGSSEYSLEAPCFVPYYYQSLGSDIEKKEWVLYCDYNRTGPTAADPDVLVGWPVYFRCTEPDNPGGVYGAMQTAHFETPVRHGSVINLADFPIEAAFGVAMIHRTPGRKALVDRVDLGSSNTKIKPQPGRTYFVSGVNNSIELTVEDGPADEFFLQVSASSDSTGITVPETSATTGPLYLGYGLSGSTVTRIVRSADTGRYYAEGYSHPANLMAAQTHTISGGAITIGLQEFVIVGTQNGDATDDLDTITPPAGVENLRIHLRSAVTGENIVLKNGTGNIQTATAGDVTLDQVRDGVTLIYRGGFWRQPSAAAV